MLWDNEDRSFKKYTSRLNVLCYRAFIIFVIANIARFCKVDAEEALRSTNNKFTKRFQYIEQKIKEKGGDFKDCSLEEMEHYWQEAKKR